MGELIRRPFMGSGFLLVVNPGIHKPVTPISWCAFPWRGNLAGVAPLSGVKLASPMLSGRYFPQHTVLPQVQSTRSANVGLFNAVVLELQTGYVFAGRNFNAYR